MNDLYQEIILEEAKYPKNKGKIDDADLVLKGVNASCGDEVTIYLKLEERRNKKENSEKPITDYSLPITDIKWEGHGCVISQAAMSLLSERVASKQWAVADIQNKNLSDILELLGLEEISPGRIKCATLGLQTLRKVNNQ